MYLFQDRSIQQTSVVTQSEHLYNHTAKYIIQQPTFPPSLIFTRVQIVKNAEIILLNCITNARLLACDMDG